MTIELDERKNAFENAAVYFDRAKKAKAKLASLEKAAIMLQQRLDQKNKQQEEVKEIQKVLIKRKKEWFEKFHWCFTSNGFLVLAGRDQSSNEHLIKKVMQPSDVYFHADVSGSAHTILVTGGKNVKMEDKEQAAAFAALWSGFWKSGSSQAEVYSVKPEQVSKKAPTGESMGAGSFMIYGEREWFKKIPLKLTVGIDEQNRVCSGPPTAIQKQCKTLIELIPGEKPKSEVTKGMAAYFKRHDLIVNLDEIQSMIPSTSRMVPQKD